MAGGVRAAEGQGRHGLCLRCCGKRAPLCVCNELTDLCDYYSSGKGTLTDALGLCFAVETE